MFISVPPNIFAIGIKKISRIIYDSLFTTEIREQAGFIKQKLYVHRNLFPPPPFDFYINHLITTYNKGLRRNYFNDCK